LNSVITNITDTKTHTDRTFVVTNESYVLYRKYRTLRPSNALSDRLFLRYAKGRCFNQNIGINIIGQIPSKIAQFLGKNDPKRYTGHSFRRTSATLLADSGGNITCIKRHGGWKSTSVAEGYIEDSLTNKILTSNKISDCEPSSSNENVHNEFNDESGKNLICQPTASNYAEKNIELKVEPSSMLYTNTSSTSPGINVGNNCTNCTINFYFSVKE
jgi:hypothetical protein